MGRTVRRLLLLLLALAIMLVIAVTPLWQGWQRLTQPWLIPLSKVSNAAGEWLSNVWRMPALLQENESLRHEVAELVARQSTSDAFYNENEELRQLLALLPPEGYARLAVEIVGQQIDETGISYLINRGRIDGLEPGLAAVAGAAGEDEAGLGLVLVGTVSQVGQRSASLVFVTASSSQVLANLARSATVQGLAVGEYNLAVRLKFLEIDQAVEVGNAVITSNLNRLIPPGLLIGTVTTVERQEGELFQSAVVAPPVRLEQFRFLYILKPIKTS